MNAAGRQSGRFQGVVPAGVLTFIALAGLSGCNTTRPTTSPAAPAARRARRPAGRPAVPPDRRPASTGGNRRPGCAPPPVAPPPPVEVIHPATADSTPPPCHAVSPRRSLAPSTDRNRRRRAKESEPQTVGPVPPPPATASTPKWGAIDGPLTSILGRNVYSPKGEDLGRVGRPSGRPEGRVRVAIVDFGGFLGSGYSTHRGRLAAAALLAGRQGQASHSHRHPGEAAIGAGIQGSRQSPSSHAAGGGTRCRRRRHQ